MQCLVRAPTAARVPSQRATGRGRGLLVWHAAVGATARETPVATTTRDHSRTRNALTFQRGLGPLAAWRVRGLASARGGSGYAQCAWTRRSAPLPIVGLEPTAGEREARERGAEQTSCGFEARANTAHRRVIRTMDEATCGFLIPSCTRRLDVRIEVERLEGTSAQHHVHVGVHHADAAGES